MKKIIYSGRYPHVNVGDVTLVRGETVEVSDELFAALTKDAEFAAPAAEQPKAVAKKPGAVPVPAK